MAKQDHDFSVSRDYLHRIKVAERRFAKKILRNPSACSVNAQIGGRGT